MIHQHIFASPKPGMSEAEFHTYWLETHAIKYASKIPQIKKYKIDTRIAWRGEKAPPSWNGVAEIWLRNEKEQLESLQTEAFLQGARLDEPKWAAFWNTLVVDTDTHVLMEGQPESQNATDVKLLVLSKRKAGMSVEQYRSHLLEAVGGVASSIPGLTRCWQCFCRDGLYAGGETRFDGVTHMWFESESALNGLPDLQWCKTLPLPAADAFVESKYVFSRFKNPSKGT